MPITGALGVRIYQAKQRNRHFVHSPGAKQASPGKEEDESDTFSGLLGASCFWGKYSLRTRGHMGLRLRELLHWWIDRFRLANFWRDLCDHRKIYAMATGNLKLEREKGGRSS